MKRFTLARIPLFTALCLAAGGAGSASAASIPWDVQMAQSGGEPILNIANAQALLDGNLAQSHSADAPYNVLNFDLPDFAGSHGKFTGDSPFPGITADDEQDFAIHAAGSIEIPSPGQYTFGVSSDDGFALTVGSNSMAHSGQRAPSESYQTYNFTHAGAYPVDLVYFQHRYNAELELFASPGAYTAFGQTGSNFQLVGDTLHGGISLVNINLPEPSQFILLIAVGVGVLWKRKPKTARHDIFNRDVFNRAVDEL